MQERLLSLALLICSCTSTADLPAATELDAPATAPTPSVESPQDPLLGFRHRGEPLHPIAVSRMAPLDLSDDDPLTIDLDGQPHIDETVEIVGAVVSFDDDQPGWDAYEVHERVGSHFLLSVTQSGGGTGIFSTVIVVEMREHQLVPVWVIPAGDRCNGGLAGEPSFDGDAVLVPRWLTPYDLVAFSTRDVSHIEAYDDLESSAMSCIGYALMRAEPDREQQSVEVTFAPGWTGQWHGDQPGWTEKYPLQPRFNGIYAEWIAAGQTELDQAAIDRFVDELLAD